MPLSYVFKRLVRSWHLYIALFIGILLASTFLAGINVGADTASKQALDQALAKIPVDFYASGYSALSSKNITKLVDEVSKVQDVKGTEAISRAYSDVHLPGKEYPYSFRLVGISAGSRVYDGWTDRPSSIEENQTYVLAGSSVASSGLIKRGDVVTVNMTIPVWNPTFMNTTFVKLTLNLTVAGFAQLNDRASAIVQGRYLTYDFGILGGPGGTIYPTYVEDTFVVDLEKTLAKFNDIFYKYSLPYYTDILVYIDRNSLISVWDIPGSLQRLNQVKQKIQNQIDMNGFGGLYLTGD